MLLEEKILGLVSLIIALVVAISVHEFAHAWMSEQLGDPTARLAGRLTLNPMAHLDPFGTLFILISGFGWGKPVPFDPFNLKEPRKDAALISLAGPTSNLILSIILTVILRFLPQSGLISTGGIIPLVAMLLISTIHFNVSLAIFNLLPISPLDGFKVVGGILPEELALQWYQLERVGYLFLLLFVFFAPGFLNLTVIPVVKTILRLLLGNTLL